MAHERLLKGRKGKHSTLSEVGEEFYRIVARIPEVSKVVISIIRGGHSGHRRIKFFPNGTGIRTVAKGHGKVQEFFVLTRTQGVVMQKITAALGPSWSIE